MFNVLESIHKNFIWSSYDQNFNGGTLTSKNNNKQWQLFHYKVPLPNAIS